MNLDLLRESNRPILNALFERVGADSEFWSGAELLLPAGAADYLCESNEFLQDLRDRYFQIVCPAMIHTQWSRSFVSNDVPLQGFRGDCAYVWQRRDINLPVSYLLTAYYLSSSVAGHLLQTLTEDNYFGIYTIRAGDGRLLTRDLLDSISEIAFLEEETGLLSGSIASVLDIGSGYGRFAHRLAQSCKDLRSVLCVDTVPESTFICDYYLRFRGITDKARAVPFTNLEASVGQKSPDLAVSIHCLDECPFAVSQWWIELLRRYSVRYFFLVVNRRAFRAGRLVSLEADGQRMDVSQTIVDAGYSLVRQCPKYRDSALQRYGVSPAIYSLYELRS